MKKKNCLYLDDIRTVTEEIPNYNSWNIVRDYNEFVNFIENNEMPDLISLDHDIHDTHYNDYFEQVSRMGWQSPKYEEYTEKTGLECAKYLCERYQNDPTSKFPSIVTVHSHNPVGTDNIISYIKGFIKHMNLDAVCYEQRFKFKI